MEQLELPLKFKPNTYESYTDVQKKEHWYAQYCIKMFQMQKLEQKIETAVKMLRSLVHQIDYGIEVPEEALSNKLIKGRIRKIYADLYGRRSHHLDDK
mgnify:CR=1 FL=1